LLERPVFELVLELFRQQYDMLILDTPCTSEVADAQVVAASADAALLLVRRGHSTQSQLVNTMKNFNECGVNVIGSVITDH